MSNKSANVIELFIQDIINGPGGWKSYEDHEIIVTSDRDVAIASWVIRCLANVENTQSGLVVDAIRQERGRRNYARNRMNMKKMRKNENPDRL